jgi:UDP-galactopyranose mutase
MNEQMFLSQRKNLNCFDSEKNKDDIVFYEYGAHFKYKNLYDCLNKLKINNSYENQKKKNSNNINYNNINNEINK